MVAPAGEGLPVDDALDELGPTGRLASEEEIGRLAPTLLAALVGRSRAAPGAVAPTEATKAFQKSGAVALYTTPPAAERIPNYPSPAQSGT